MFDQKWAKVLAFALSLPSSILGMAFFSMYLVEHNILSKGWAFGLFLAVVINTILLMVIYAYKNKDKS
jgi:uncharacterized membrane protein (UPF0136 family)